MRLVFTYDNSELRECGKIASSAGYEVSESHVETGKKHLYDVAVEIKKKIKAKEKAIIFIPQFLDCADEEFKWLQDNAGIALIKFLRMLKVRQHIVLITPYKNLQLIQEDPGNLIVSSLGVSFLSYLYQVRDVSLEKFQKLAKKTFDEKQDRKPYILTEFRLPEDERHNWANWWGIDRLWNVHRVVEQKKYGLTERWNLKEYPDYLKSKLKAVRNREALFLYGHQEKFIANNLAELNDEANKLSEIVQRYISARDLFIENQNTIQSTKKDRTQRIENLETQISYINKLLPLLNGLSESFLKMRDENIRRLIELSKEIRGLDEELTKEKQRTRQIDYAISEKENRLTELNNALSKEEEIYLWEWRSGIDSLKNEIQKLQSKILSLSIPALREKLQKRSPNILYIDDQADEGWSNIFRNIIYNNEEQERFKVIQPKKTDNINAQYFIEVVCPEIISHYPDLILLDLRLNKESGIRSEVENLSGALLLKEIKKRFPGIPVMMTTASNKSWSYEELQRIGCDAFWTKEGIDTGMTEHDSVKNYLRFIELVNLLTESQYHFLKDFANRIYYLKAQDFHWWENPEWLNSDKDQYRKDLKVEKEIVFKLLGDTIIICRDYLRTQISRSVFGEVLNDWLYPSLIIINLAKVVEHIHGISQGGSPTVKYIRQNRGDQTAADLLQHRALAAHYAYSEKISFEVTREFCDSLIHYLEKRQSFTTGLKIIGKIDLS